MFPKISGTPKLSILIGVFHYKPSILVVFPPIFGNTHIVTNKRLNLVGMDFFLGGRCPNLTGKKLDDWGCSNHK